MGAVIAASSWGAGTLDRAAGRCGIDRHMDLRDFATAVDEHGVFRGF